MVLVLFAFMLSVRAALIVAAVIPLSLGASFLYLHRRGMSANLLSIGAVDFGIIVDGAVILVEHVFHGVSQESAAIAAGKRAVGKVVLESARAVARPTLFSLLIIIAAYLPIFALQRVEGRIFAPMAHTVVSALVGALAMSFTLGAGALRDGAPQAQAPPRVAIVGVRLADLRADPPGRDAPLGGGGGAGGGAAGAARWCCSERWDRSSSPSSTRGPFM